MTRFEAIVSVLRDIARGALAGLIVGVVVLGPGGRIVMRLAAVVDPEAAGRHTENGNRIGDITIEGTFVLLIFGGLLIGAASSVIWGAIQEWIPSRRFVRAALAALIAVALTGFQLIRPENHDFRILEPVVPILALLLGLVAVAGFAFAVVDGWLDRRLPQPSPRPTPAVAIYAVMLLAGLPFVLVAAQFFFTPGFAVRQTPVIAGLAVVATGCVTAAAWLVRVASGRPEPPRALRRIGGATLAVAVVAGTLHLATQVAQVVAIGA